MEKNMSIENLDLLKKHIENISKEIEQNLDCKIEECEKKQKEIKDLMLKQAEILAYALEMFEPIYKKIYEKHFRFLDIEKKLSILKGPIIYYGDNYPKTLIYYDVNQSFLYENEIKGDIIKFDESRRIPWHKYLENYSFESALSALIYSAKNIENLILWQEETILNIVNDTENGLSKIEI